MTDTSNTESLPMYPGYPIDFGLDLDDMDYVNRVPGGIARSDPGLKDEIFKRGVASVISPLLCGEVEQAT